jgi:hypothetical protein
MPSRRAPSPGILRRATDQRSPSAAYHFPRSRHRPVAPTDGSLTENVNEIGVRLWTDRIAVTLTLSFTARWTSRAADIETLDQPLFEPKDVAD